MKQEEAVNIAASLDMEEDPAFELHLMIGAYRCVWKGDRKLWVYSRFGWDGYPANSPVDVLRLGNPEGVFSPSEVNIDTIQAAMYPFLAERESSGKQ